MKIRKNNNDINDNYKGFKLRQTTILELAIGDNVVVMLNGVELYNETIEFGVDSHVDVIMQDIGAIATGVEKIDAQIAELQRQKVEEKAKEK